MLALCIQIARKLRHVYSPRHTTFATFGRQLKCLLVRPGGGGALEFSVMGLCPSKNFSSPNEGIFRVNRHPIGEFFKGNDTQ